MSSGSSIHWYEAAAARVERALASRTAIGDRGAMLRELCRLRGGFLDLSDRAGLVTDSDRGHFARFGLKYLEHGGGGLMIDEAAMPGLDGLAEILRVDPSPRQDYPAASADAILLRHSRYPHYRAPTQKAAVRALATMPDGGSLLVTLPTGAGKSLLFQIAPGLSNAPGACAVVIVPTVALAIAHVDALRTINGLESSRCIHGGLAASEREETANAFARGEVPILVLSPEVAIGALCDLLVEAAEDPANKVPGLNARLATFFIDEAHIVESWGRTFRPDFQRLPGLVAALRGANPALRTVLLSATVNDSARAELVRAYGATDFLAVEAKVPRYEFDLVHARIDTATQRDALLVELIDQLPRPAIIYTTLVSHAEELHRRLKAREFDRLALFTGQVTDGDARLEIISRWRAGEIDLVVATSAFGMGIDKDDVRAVIHACVPESPSRYYQEIGRAARDGNQALALMLWTDDRGRQGDWRQARKLWSGSWLTPEMMRKRWGAIGKAADRRDGSRIVDGRHLLEAPLDAFHDGIPHGDSDYNQDWNRSLINMLQRVGALRVLATGGTASLPVWSVEILDGRLLSEQRGDDYWQEVAERRKAERDAAIEDLDAFKGAISRPRACATSEIFALVEAGSPLVPACGHCEFCREHGEKPPPQSVIEFRGLDRRWKMPRRDVRLAAGISIVNPDRDDLPASPELIETLVAVGIEQFVVPDDQAQDFALRLRDRACRYGFVSSHEDLLGRWKLADLPTAFLLDQMSRPDKMVDKIEEIAKAETERVYLVVAPSRLLVRGKPIVNSLSNRAPMSEAGFKRLIQDWPAS